MTKPVSVLLLFLVLSASHAGAAQLLVSISGLEDAELDNVVNSLQLVQLLPKESLLDKATRQTPNDIGDVSDVRIKRLHRSAKAEIQRALQPFGYYNPSIETSLALVEGVWNASYNISSGKAVIVSELEINITGSGSTLEVLQKKIDASGLVVGGRLLHQEYSATKNGLLQTAIDQGFLDARFSKSSLRVNPKSSSASIALELETGEAYYFGPVTINQDILRDEFVQLYIPFKEGDIFNPDRLIALQIGLSDSGYFDRVELTADRRLAENYRIPVVVDAIAARPRKYTVGFGYGTDTKLRFKTGAVFRRINELGHNIHADLLLSAVKRSVSGQYEIPMGNAGTDSLRFLAKYEDEDVGEGDGEAERVLLGVNYNDTWQGMQRRLYLDYQIEDFRFGDEANSVTFLIPGVNLSYTKADNVLLPTRGYSWFLDLHGGAESVLSDTSFVQGRAVGQRVWSMSERSRLLGRLEFGATTVNSFPDLPPSQRFFAGGDRSVRGYAYQSLGPEDDDGNVIGGRYLSTASLELDYLFYSDFGGALFFDAGNASNDTEFSWARGYGAGIRWRSPVGMFKLDLAKPLDDPTESFRLHISIGADL